MVTLPTLNLVREAKICDLTACDQQTTRYEASGVLVKDGHYFVVFDDRTEIGRFSDDLQPTNTNGLFGMALPQVRRPRSVADGVSSVSHSSLSHSTSRGTPERTASLGVLSTLRQK